MSDAKNEDLYSQIPASEPAEDFKIQRDFRPTLYPKSQKRMNVAITPLGKKGSLREETTATGHTVTLSTDGLEFRSSDQYEEGSLIKLEVNIPQFWTLKGPMVDYQRIDNPDTFRVLGRVVKNETVGKRGKKNLITVETLVIDEVDKQVLYNFLQDQ